jgi:hypothetical protein
MSDKASVTVDNAPTFPLAEDTPGAQGAPNDLHTTEAAYRPGDRP